MILCYNNVSLITCTHVDFIYRYVLTYKFSQDHLEIFFGIVRLRLGCNDNPNVSQFRTCMKKILLKNDIRPSTAGNCALFEPIVGGIFDMCLRKRIARGKKTDLIQSSEEDSFEDTLAQYPAFENNVLRDNILFYIAGFIAKKISVTCQCMSCNNALFSNNYEHDYAKMASYTLLTRFKNRGGLILPSSDVFKVVLETERQLFPFFGNLRKLTASQVTCRVKRNLILTCQFGTNCNDEDFMNPHKSILINNICAFYIKIRMFSISKHFSDVSRMGIRNKSKKVVDFKNL